MTLALEKFSHLLYRVCFIPLLRLYAEQCFLAVSFYVKILLYSMREGRVLFSYNMMSSCPQAIEF
jgi:hypothetical protein